MVGPDLFLTFVTFVWVLSSAVARSVQETGWIPMLPFSLASPTLTG
jgi:hypothetical protein